MVLAGGGLLVATVLPSRAQEPGEESFSQKLNRGVNRIGEELRQGWIEVRKSVDKLGVQGRVYGRLHWDKALADATIDIQVRDDHIVVLKGSVDSESAKNKAVQLAQDTTGVSQVVDELAVLNK